jgi:hypothetical protein
VSKFTYAQRGLIKDIVATLSISKTSNEDIIREIEKQTGKTINVRYLRYVRTQIKKGSKEWYEDLRESKYEYIYQFKERINEIVDLQRRHYTIIENNPNSPAIQQTSLAELHRLNITLSNYFDVAPIIVNPVRQNDNSISIPQQDIIV